MSVTHRITNNGVYAVPPGTPHNTNRWCGDPNGGQTMVELDVVKWPSLMGQTLCPNCIALGGATVPMGGSPIVRAAGTPITPSTPTKTLHRLDDLGNKYGWCDTPLSVMTGHDGTDLPLDASWVGRFTICQLCVDLHGDTLAKGSTKPKIVHNATSDKFSGMSYLCGATSGLFSGAGQCSYEQCARDQVNFNVKLVPCRRCMALRDPKSASPFRMAKKLDDGFNGNCTTCGKRTYTGATPSGFEHQGGPCLGRRG